MANNTYPVHAVANLRDVVMYGMDQSNPTVRIAMNKEALKGGYVLSPEQAAVENARRESGKHLADNGGLAAKGSMPAGKLPSHITYSTESPYDIGIAASKGGVWSTDQYGDVYTPSKQVVDRQGLANMAEYFTSGKETGRMIPPTGRELEYYRLLQQMKK